LRRTDWHTSAPVAARSRVPRRGAANRTLDGTRPRRSRLDFLAYVVINAFLVVVWAVTGAGYFWPGWVLAGWGVLLLLDAWDVYYRKPLTEADIGRELGKRR
jgi:2TM domain